MDRLDSSRCIEPLFFLRVLEPQRCQLIGAGLEIDTHGVSQPSSIAIFLVVIVPVPTKDGRGQGIPTDLVGPSWTNLASMGRWASPNCNRRHQWVPGSASLARSQKTPSSRGGAH